MSEKTLRVKMNVSMAGAGFGYTVGEEHDLPEALAVAFCTLPEDGPRANPVGWKPKAGTKTTATRAKRETAVTPKPAGEKPEELPDPTRDLPL